MPTYRTPGVYVQEITTSPPSVAPVETAIPAFIGYTEKATEIAEGDLIKVPKRIVSLFEYERYFGTAKPETTIGVAIFDRLVIGRTEKTINVTPPSTSSPFLMYYSMQIYFLNGGGPCYIVSVNEYEDSGNVNPVLFNELNQGLDLLEKEDEPTLIVFPDATGLSISDFHSLYNNALNQCNKLKDRFTIVDSHSSENYTVSIGELRNGLNPDPGSLKYGAAYFPHVVTSLDYNYDENSVIIDHIIQERESRDTHNGELHGKPLGKIENTDSALYNMLKKEIAQLPLVLPPSSAIAGVYARVDSTRGVWKAPANVEVEGVTRPLIGINDAEQEWLNIDQAEGRSVNAIRIFEGKGTLVWGARTLAGNDNEWRYVPVRRFFNFVEESVKKATAVFVFEHNDANTWVRIKAMIENFLTLQWRNGALQGATPVDAFYVQVGLGETMTSTDILEGRMNIEIGMALVRPAEFIILKFSHKMQES